MTSLQTFQIGVRALGWSDRVMWSGKTSLRKNIWAETWMKSRAESYVKRHGGRKFQAKGTHSLIWVWNIRQYLSRDRTKSWGQHFPIVFQGTLLPWPCPQHPLPPPKRIPLSKDNFLLSVPLEWYSYVLKTEEYQHKEYLTLFMHLPSTGPWYPLFLSR